MLTIFLQNAQKIGNIFYKSGEQQITEKEWETIQRNKWGNKLIQNNLLRIVSQTKKKKIPKKIFDFSNIDNIDQLHIMLDKASGSSEKEAISIRIQQLADNEIQVD